jgi:peptidoglycan hydrolase-like protein with peptidoglycan-binding domain
MLKNKLFAGAIFALALFVAGSVSAAYTFPNKIDTLQEKKDVQTVLNMVVTPSPALTVDGVMGAKSIAAVKAFQTMKGLTADGLIGPMTRAALEAAQAGATVVTAGCPAGALFNATTGAPCATVTTTVPGCVAGALFSSTTGASCTTGVTTPVISGSSEGYMTLQSAPVALVSSVGQSEVGDAIAAFAVKATNSDIKVQRVSINLVPSSSALPWKYFTNLSLYQGSTLLATLPVTSTSLTENSFGLDYTAVFSGFNAVVTKDSISSFVVKADIVSTIPTGSITFNVGLKNGDANAVRGVDGIGLSQYVGATSAAYIKTVNFNGTAAGVVKVVANGSNPIAQNVVTSTTTTTTNIPALIFDLQNTSKYDETIKSITATLSGASSTNGTKVSGYYLYDGATMIASLGNPGVSTLSFINLPSNFTVSANSTKTLSIKFDAAMSATGAVNVTIPVGGVTAVDANSNLITSTGAGTGNDQTLQSTGVVVNLVSAIATATPSTTGVSGYATGTFVFMVKANGVNLAKLSLGTNIVAAGTVNGAGSLGNLSYTITPDTTVSDGSEVKVTVTTTQTTASAGNVKFAITGITFKDTDGNNVVVNTGLDNFYTNTVYAN